MKILLYLFLTSFLFIGCGVETSSSSIPSSSTDSTDNGGTDTNSTDNGGTDTNSTGNGGADTNSTDTNTTDTNTTDPIVVEDEDFGVSTYDPQACRATNGYSLIKDNSFDPSGYTDNANGIKVTSFFPKTFIASSSEVKLFHPGLDGELKDNLILLFEAKYSFSYDESWLTNSNNVIYIDTALYTSGNSYCFRYQLDSTDRNQIERVLVHNTQ